MNTWRWLIEQLPFEWAQYGFMQNALLAVLLVSPLYAALGALVVNHRMSFFSDAIGHSALTGIGIGVVLGLGDPLWAMIGFAVVLAVAVTLFQRATRASTDMIICVFMSFAVALGVVILSRGGGFQKFSRYLIGDLLGVSHQDLAVLATTVIVTLIAVSLFFNQLILVGLNPSLARSRGVNTTVVQIFFAVLVAVVVTMSVQWVGILVINALLVIPAAAARNIARDTRQYLGWATVFSVFCGVCGLVSSYYWDTATGATIVLFAMVFFVATLGMKWIWN